MAAQLFAVKYRDSCFASSVHRHGITADRLLDDISPPLDPKNFATKAESS
jgi:hypothetical protein